MKARVISVVNQKGGVGKTTTAVNLATIFAVMDKKVLIIDIDSQGNTSSGLGIKQTERKITSYNVFIGLNSIRDAILATEVPNLSIVSANTNLAAIELDLIHLKNYENILLEKLEEIKNDFDYIIIDCPPSLGLITLNALVACDEVLIPMLCDFYSLEGLSHLLKTVEIIEKKMNPGIKIGGILFTMYDKRNKLTEQVENDVRACLGKLVYKTTIPRNVKVSEAPSHGKAAIIYDYRCSGSRAYIDLAKEIIDNEVNKELKTA
ncbi:MAG: ParA family protein [Rickettsiaceae bacterium]|jgi:chromosome partitioning protein|uniref:ParA family protein n=1 Tax=Candidatus Megaera polyxenophila TaxID=988779 RepID=UPI001B7B75F5|nr:ParA family protein [Rickettsiaceae bacterium]WHA07268.1 ParA family protein [Candidatus Megaera polyxenophila]BBB56457.1 chromosome partitioning protein ParA [Candidatus Megaera polyxenophila]